MTKEPNVKPDGATKPEPPPAPPRKKVPLMGRASMRGMKLRQMEAKKAEEDRLIADWLIRNATSVEYETPAGGEAVYEFSTDPARSRRELIKRARADL